MGVGRGGKKTEFKTVAYITDTSVLSTCYFVILKILWMLSVFCDLSFITCLQFVKNLETKFLLNFITNKITVVNVPLLLLTWQEFPYPKRTLIAKVSSEQYVCSLFSPVLCLREPEKSLHPALKKIIFMQCSNHYLWQ